MTSPLRVISNRRQGSYVVLWSLIAVLLLLMIAPINGQSSKGNQTRRTRQPPSTNRVTKPAVPVNKPVINAATPSPVLQTPKPAAVNSGISKTPPRAPSNDIDGNAVDEEEDDETQEGDREMTGLTTKPPPVSVVTAPMPRIPLEETFRAVGGEKNATCLMMKTGVRFTFSYINASSGKVERGVTDLPARNYTADSQCSAARQRLSLIFTPEHRTTTPSEAEAAGLAWNLTVSLVVNDTDKTYSADVVSLRYAVVNGHLPFPWSVDARQTAVLKRDAIFRTPVEGFSFICMSDAGFRNFTILPDSVNGEIPTPLPATPGGDDSPKLTNGSLAFPALLEMIEFYNFQLQAFMKSESAADSLVFATSVVQCKEDFISYKVPIGLGVTLLIFVVTVVVVYVVNRMKHGKQKDEKRQSADYRAVH